MKLVMTRHLLNEVHSHAVESYPRECCGILLGHYEGGVWEAREFWRARNLAPESRNDRYLMDPADRLAAERWVAERKQTIVGFYHSHPDHDVYFSETDARNSEEFLMGEPWLPPTYGYLVVSVRARQPSGEGAFIMLEGSAQRLTLDLVDTTN